MSLEKLDRASPDLWPEQSEFHFDPSLDILNLVHYILSYFILANDEVPGVNEFVAQNSLQSEAASWSAALTPDDINQLHRNYSFTQFHINT